MHDKKWKQILDEVDLLPRILDHNHADRSRWLNSDFRDCSSLSYFVTWRSMLQVLEARDRRSVVVTTPTSVKSFMLKLVELLHKLDISRMQRAEQREDDTTTASHIRF